MGEKPLFVRSSSGLVRELSSFSFMSYGFVAMSFFWVTFFWIALMPLIGGNLLLGMLLFAICMMTVVVVYYAFTVMMPRSGGDYVFMSRTLHPMIGFVFNFGWGAIFLMEEATAAVSITTSGVSALLGYMGVVFNNSSWLNLATAMTTYQLIVPLGVVWIVAAALIAGASIKWFIRVTNISFIVCLLGFFAMIVGLAIVTPQSYQTAFNAFASNYMGKSADYYNGVITSSQAAGLQIPDQTSLWGGFMLFPALGIANFFQWQSQLGGEIRNPRKSALYGLVGTGVLFIIITYAALLVIYNVIGFQFLSAADYLMYNAPNKIPLPALPYAGMLAVIAMNPILGIFVSFASILGPVVSGAAIFLYMSRGFFAYSFDGILPQWFAKIDNRTSGPLRSTLVAALITGIFFVIVNIPASAAYAYLIASASIWVIGLDLCVMGLAALVVATRKPKLLALSPIKATPLEVLGIMMLIFGVVLTYLPLTQPVYGANTPIAIEMMVGMLVVIGLIYVAARLKKGSVLELSFKEIPPV